MASRHLFVCTHSRSSGKPACGSAGDALIAAVQRELIARGACDVLITHCGCLGPCFDGPNAVIYPDGAWYAGLEATDAADLVEHLVSGVPLVAKLSERPGDPASADDTPQITGNRGQLERPLPGPSEARAADDDGD